MSEMRSAEAGQAVYSKFVLSIYDLYVHGLSNHLIWRCPTRRIIDHYNRHLSANHLDVGVGTGYFLDKCEFPQAEPSVALMDMNQNSLDATAERIRRYQPQCYRRNVLEPLGLDHKQFDSIGMNYLLHCLPGSMQDKAVVFDSLYAHLAPGGVLFGTTLVQDGEAMGWAARWLMETYNRKGIFTNRDDTVPVLEAILSSRFAEYTIERVGCAVLFSATK